MRICVCVSTVPIGGRLAVTTGHITRVIGSLSNILGYIGIYMHALQCRGFRCIVIRIMLIRTKNRGGFLELLRTSFVSHV